MAELIRPSMYKFRFSFLILFFILSISSFNVYGLSGDTGFIDLDLWTEVTETLPTVNKNNPSYLTDSEIYHRTLEDALWIVSGMIYGFNVSYTPLDLERHVEEYLDVSPVASILWGDKNLTIVDTWVKNGKMYVQARYFLDDTQITRRKLWESNIFPDAEGTGVVSIFAGHKGRIESIKTGIKIALRNYLRIRDTNKPREIHCKVLLKSPPYTILNAGGYKSRVIIIIKFTEIMPYSFY